MIANIGYAYACAERATIDINGEPFILPAILGINDDIGLWVGTIIKPFETHIDHLHHILLHYDKYYALFYAEVKLFLNSLIPCYGVTIGKLKQTALT